MTLILLFVSMLIMAEPAQLVQGQPPFLLEGPINSDYQLTVEMELNHYARLHIRQISAKISVSVTAPSGAVVASNSPDYLLLSPIYLSFIAQERGVYRVHVTVADTIRSRPLEPKPEKGSFEITLVEELAPEAYSAQQKQYQNNPRAEYIKKQAIPLSTLDSGSDDLEDLAPLVKIIGSASILMIGDATHFDAQTYAARLRLIRFLHQRMGFDVIAFESDMYAVQKLQQLVASEGSGSSPLWENAIVPYSRYQEFVPIIDYINSQQKTSKPLYLAGFDPQIGRGYTREWMIDELKSLIAQFQLEPLPEEYSQILKNAWELNYLSGANKAPATEVRNELLTYLKQLQSRLEEVPKKGLVSDSEFMARSLNSLAFLMKWLTLSGPEYEADVEDFYTLDRSHLMAENLVWLANRVYPKRKIIVLSANAHIQADPSLIRVIDRDKYLHPHFLMGKLLREKLGKQLYSIGVSSYDGGFGPPQEGKTSDEYRIPLQVDQEEGLGLEELFVHAGLNNAFLDFSHLLPGGEWLNEPVSARPFGHQAYIGPWPKVFDGLLFIKTLEPVHPRN